MSAFFFPHRSELFFFPYRLEPFFFTRWAEQTYKMTDTEEVNPSVRALSVKLPEFWPSKPSLWFKQAEAAFRRANITRSFTKYDHVLIKLPREILDSVADIVEGVEDSTADPYEQLRDRLVKDYGPTQWQRCDSIIDHPGLGDSRPSHLMAQMLSLLPPEEKPGILFQAHFLRHMPSDIRTHLAAQKFESARAMASHADLLWDARGQRQVVQALTGQSKVRLGSSSPTKAGSQTSRRQRSPSQRSPSPDNRAKLCFYHSRFGTKARVCKAPCDWTGNDPAAGNK